VSVAFALRNGGAWLVCHRDGGEEPPKRYRHAPGRSALAAELAVEDDGRSLVEQWLLLAEEEVEYLRVGVLVKGVLDVAALVLVVEAAVDDKDAREEGRVLAVKQLCQLCNYASVSCRGAQSECISHASLSLSLTLSAALAALRTTCGSILR